MSLWWTLCAAVLVLEMCVCIHVVTFPCITPTHNRTHFKLEVLKIKHVALIIYDLCTSQHSARFPLYRHIHLLHCNAF